LQTERGGGAGPSSYRSNDGEGRSTALTVVILSIVVILFGFGAYKQWRTRHDRMELARLQGIGSTGIPPLSTATIDNEYAHHGIPPSYFIQVL
jgi:hypothetical protein